MKNNIPKCEPEPIAYSPSLSSIIESLNNEIERYKKITTNMSINLNHIGFNSYNEGFNEYLELEDANIIEILQNSVSKLYNINTHAESNSIQLSKIIYG